jgi:hypothetical protein
MYWASAGLGEETTGEGRHRSDDQTGAVGPLLLDPPARRGRLDNRHDELLAPPLEPQSPEGRNPSEKEPCHIRDDEGGGVHHRSLLSALDGGGEGDAATVRRPRGNGVAHPALLHGGTLLTGPRIPERSCSNNGQ